MSMPVLYNTKYNITNNVDLHLLLPVESLSKNMDSATLSLQPTLWSKVVLHPYHSLLQEPLCSVGLHVIKLYNPAMTEKKRGHLSLALHNVNSFALLRYKREGRRAESMSWRQGDGAGSLNYSNAALFFESFTAGKNLWFNTVLQAALPWVKQLAHYKQVCFDCNVSEDSSAAPSIAAAVVQRWSCGSHSVRKLSASFCYSGQMFP